MPGLGRRFAPDPRDVKYPLRMLIAEPPKRKWRYWRSGPILDQGNTPSCVGHAWKQWLSSAPIMDKPSSPPDAMTIYHEAQKVDEWAGENYEGTSVRGGAKYLADQSRLGAYHWATTAEDVRDYILSTGGVVIGINWYEDMFDPPKSGVLKVSGPLAGGHALFLNGYSEARGAFRGDNSWSPHWGDHGRFWMLGEDFARLLSEEGEACAGLEIKA